MAYYVVHPHKNNLSLPNLTVLPDKLFDGEGKVQKVEKYPSARIESAVHLSL
jgi:hypothetical protein